MGAGPPKYYQSTIIPRSQPSMIFDTKYNREFQKCYTIRSKPPGGSGSHVSRMPRQRARGSHAPPRPARGPIPRGTAGRRPFRGLDALGWRFPRSALGTEESTLGRRKGLLLWLEWPWGIRGTALWVPALRKPPRPRATAAPGGDLPKAPPSGTGPVANATGPKGKPKSGEIAPARGSRRGRFLGLPVSAPGEPKA